MKSKLLFAVCLLATLSCIHSKSVAGETHSEAEYIKALQLGLAGAGHFDVSSEYKLLNGTIADLVTRQRAIEVEFAPKWAESIGQALSYGLSTKRQPTVVLLLREDEDARFLRRLLPVANEVGVDVWVYHVREIISD